jgi:hypothetical protein
MLPVFICDLVSDTVKKFDIFDTPIVKFCRSYSGYRRTLMTMCSYKNKFEKIYGKKGNGFISYLNSSCRRKLQNQGKPNEDLWLDNLHILHFLLFWITCWIHVLALSLWLFLYSFFIFRFFFKKGIFWFFFILQDYFNFYLLFFFFDIWIFRVFLWGFWDFRNC